MGCDFWGAALKKGRAGKKAVIDRGWVGVL